MILWTIIQLLTLVTVILILFFPVVLLLTQMERAQIRKPDIYAFVPKKIKGLSEWISGFHMADVHAGQLVIESADSPLKDWWFKFRIRYVLSMYAFFGFFNPAKDWRDAKYQNMTNVITGLDPYWVISKITGSAYARINEAGPKSKEYWRYNTYVQVNVIASIVGLVICFGPVAFLVIAALNALIFAGAAVMRALLTPLRSEIIDRVFTDIRTARAEEVIEVIGKKAINTHFNGMASGEFIYAVAMQTPPNFPVEGDESVIVYATNQFARHYHLFGAVHQYYENMGIIDDAPIGEVTQGFITNTGRFVNRVEAMNIAIKTNVQLSAADQQTAKDMVEKGLDPELYSEHIQ